jgi:hypothetical protein
VSGWYGKREVIIIQVNHDEVGGVRFSGVYVASMQRGDKDHATRVSSLTNEEPLGVVEACVDIMQEVV